MLIEAKDNSKMAESTAPVINVAAPAAPAQGFYGQGGQQVNSTWVITGFIAFLIIIWGIWRSHSQTSDVKHELNNALNQSLMSSALNQQRLQDIQNSQQLAQVMATTNRENDLRFGTTVSGYQSALASGRGRSGGGAIVNGGGITDTFQADNSVF